MTPGIQPSNVKMMLRKKLAMRPVISTASGGNTTQKKYRSAFITTTHCPGIHLSRSSPISPTNSTVNHTAMVRSPTRNNLCLPDRPLLQFSVAFRPASQFRSRGPLFSRAKYVPEKPDNALLQDGIGRGRGANRDKPSPASLPTATAPVVLRDRDHRHVAKFLIQRNQIRNIQPPMQRSYLGNRLPSTERKMQVIDMKMNDVELAPRAEKHVPA